jgi:hypothetical protein
MFSVVTCWGTVKGFALHCETLSACYLLASPNCNKTTLVPGCWCFSCSAQGCYWQLVNSNFRTPAASKVAESYIDSILGSSHTWSASARETSQPLAFSQLQTHLDSTRTGLKYSMRRLEVRALSACQPCPSSLC